MPTTSRPDLTVSALASLAAAAIALALWIFDPFDHGTWLVAYLVLVGFLAQLLLGLGQSALVSTRGLSVPSRQVRLVQAHLWNLGVVTVPFGVLMETRLVVVAGSVSLMIALASLWKSVHPALAWAVALPSPSLAYGYAGLLVAMAASTVIGTALAWDIPWT